MSRSWPRASAPTCTAPAGIRRMEELAALDAMGVDAAILGKSLYTGALDLAECVRRYETKG